MPIYEYECQSCGHQLEALQKMSDPVLSDCPQCHQPALKKLISAGGFKVKGSGAAAAGFGCGLGGNDAPAPCSTGVCPARE